MNVFEIPDEEYLCSQFLRDAARACKEDFHGWASSVFPINDLKSCSASKSQSLGKHKLGVADSSKFAKSKHRKTGPDNGESSHHLITDHQMPSLVQEDNHNLYSLSSPILTDYSFPFGMDEYPFPHEEPGSLEMIPHDYIPGLISGLDIPKEIWSSSILQIAIYCQHESDLLLSGNFIDGCSFATVGHSLVGELKQGFWWMEKPNMMLPDFCLPFLLVLFLSIAFQFLKSFKSYIWKANNIRSDFLQFEFEHASMSSSIFNYFF